MPKIVALIAVFGLGFAAAPALPDVPGAGQEDSSKQVMDLTQKVAALEARVVALEKSLREITVRIPQGFPELQDLPKGWEKRYFNGIPYYVIPISKDAEDRAKIVR